MLKRTQKMPTENQTALQSNWKNVKLGMFKLKDIPQIESREVTPRPVVETQLERPNGLR